MRTPNEIRKRLNDVQRTIENNKKKLDSAIENSFDYTAIKIELNMLESVKTTLNWALK